MLPFLLKTFLVSLKETREIDAIQPAELDDVQDFAANSAVNKQETPNYWIRLWQRHDHSSKK